MARLDNPIQERIDDIITEGSDLYDKGDLKKSIEFLEKARQELPEPKHIYD